MNADAFGRSATTGARRAKPKVRVPIVAMDGGAERRAHDLVAGEEPMEIRLVVAGAPVPVAVTMRTPGNDFELAAGFLFSEGIVPERDRISGIRYCTDVDEDQHYNVVNVELRGGTAPDVARLERHFTVNSSCGVCGKAHLDAIAVRGLEPVAGGPRVSAATLRSLPGTLRDAQELFGATGGLHAAGLFGADGTLIAIREDVGRHNAMDKLLGWALLEGHDPSELIVCVSGRASFELLQKAVAARIAVFAAVSAPSSLAVQVASRFGVTLVGFLREGRFNVYAGERRIGE